MKNYGQITEDKDIINKKYADTLNASSLHKSGDEVAEGQKTFNGKVLIKNLTLNTERPWTFEQSNTGANTTLDLKSEFDGKVFRITSPLKTKGISIAQSETGDNNWLAPIADNVTDLGRNSYKWRNLYIKGNISNGTNSVNVGSIVTKNNKRYVNYDNYFAVNTAGKYGKLFVSDKLTQSWDSITLIFEISDKNGINNTRGVARYSITYRGNGTNAPGLKVTRLFGDANYDSVLFINYVSTPYVDANSNYFELYYLGSYDGDDARKFQVISYSRRSSEEVGYTLNKGALVNLDEITSIGTVSKFTDIVLVYYCAKNQPATITGAWKFETNSAKFKVGTDVYRIPLTAPAGSSTEKRYILATSGYNQPATMFNPNVFQQGNHIYSNASQVVNLADEQTISGLKTFTKTLKLKNTDNAYNDTPSPVTSRSFYFTDKNDAIVSIINTTIGTSWNALNFQLKGKNNVTTTLEYVCSGNATDGYTWRFDPVTDNLVDLGASSRRWKNLYIAGNLSDGTNSVPVSEIANLSSEQTISGLKNFDNAKFKVNDNDYRVPLTAPAVENSDKRYLTGVSGLSTKFTNINNNCYMQNGKLYSNGAEVALTNQTYKRLYTSISELGITASTCTISELAQKIIDNSYTNSKVLINIENNSPITDCPSSYGTLEIEVPSLSIRMSIKFTVQRGNQSLNSTYFGYLTRSGNTVTAFEWRKALTNKYDWIDDVLSGTLEHGEKILKNSANDYTGANSSEYYWGKSRKYSSGLIIQWGEISPNVDKTDYQSGNITFPQPFSGNNTYAIVLTGCRASSGSYRDTTFIAYNPASTGTGYMWYGQSNNSDRWKIRWVAIGT